MALVFSLSGCETTLPTMSELTSYIPEIPGVTQSNEPLLDAETVATVEPSPIAKKEAKPVVKNPVQKLATYDKPISLEKDVLRIGQLEVNKTRFNELPRRCFNIDAPLQTFSLHGATYYGPEYVNCGSWPGTILIESSPSCDLTECLGGDYDKATARFVNDVLYQLIIQKKGNTEFIKQLKAAIPDLKLVKSDRYDKADYYDSKDFKITPYVNDGDTLATHSFYITSKHVDRNAVRYMKAHGYPRIGSFVFQKTTKKSLHKFLQDEGFFQTPLDAKLNTYRGSKDLNLFGVLPFGEDGTEIMLIFNKHDVLDQIRLQPAYQGCPAMTVSEFARKTKNVLSYEGFGDSLLFNIPVPGKKMPKFVDHQFFHRTYSPDKTQSFALFLVTVHVVEGSDVIDSITIENPYRD